LEDTVNTTSLNVATNTPAVIARKRGIEGALIVIGVGALVDGIEAVVQVAACHPGTPCTYDWALILNVALTAVIGGVARGITAYLAANANVAANAALQPVPVPPGETAAAVPQPPATPAKEVS
jgi:hypothetical protein